jgi:hypothetical protein
MTDSIPAFAERVDHWQKVLASIISKVGATKRATEKVKLGSLWGAEHQAAFIDMQNQLRNLAVMAYPNPSDEFYGGMITQIEKANLELSVDHQRHEPLAFFSGAFKGAQQRWAHQKRKDSR